jgi:hypothetical protein
MWSDGSYTPTGPTEELSLRVSVATLVRVVFQDPRDGRLMLALERKATLHPDGEGGRVLIKSQPFGGAIRIKNLARFRDSVGDFRFDSERSRSERDFRIFIPPSDWEAVRAFCLGQFANEDDSILETTPKRELEEELADTLGIALKPEQYSCKPLKTMVENNPAATDNVHARGHATVRVYRVFEARILDPALGRLISEESEQLSNQSLRERARGNARKGGKGWANAVLVLPMEAVMAFYRALPLKSLDAPVHLGENILDSNVCAILDGIAAPKYRSL